MQPTVGDALNDSEVALEELTRCLGDLRQRVEAEGDYTDHMQQVLSDDITRLNGLLVEKDRAIQDLERLRDGQASRIRDLIWRNAVQGEDIEALNRVIGEQGGGLREKDKEIEQLAQAEDDQRQARRDAQAEVDRLTKALRQCAYQRDNAVADKTIAQAVVAKANEEAKALRQQVRNLRDEAAAFRGQVAVQNAQIAALRQQVKIG